jgi:type II secretory pathway pseudopilin PulG
MKSPPHHREIQTYTRGFTFIEITAVIAVLVTLTTVGISLLNNTNTYSRRTTTQLVTALVAQARACAITSRCEVALAFAEPTDLTPPAGSYQLGLFKLTTSPTSEAKAVGNLVQRWETINHGLVLLPDDLTELPNLMSQERLEITYGGSKNSKIRVHALIFDSRGKICFPPGSSPLALRLAEGRYHDGKAVSKTRAQTNVTETRLKIGRLTGRIYPFD